jgi:hypothetical protein
MIRVAASFCAAGREPVDLDAPRPLFDEITGRSARGWTGSGTSTH